jgi:hypothetical protein
MRSRFVSLSTGASGALWWTQWINVRVPCLGNSDWLSDCQLEGRLRTLRATYSFSVDSESVICKKGWTPKKRTPQCFVRTIFKTTERCTAQKETRGGGRTLLRWWNNGVRTAREVICSDITWQVTTGNNPYRLSMWNTCATCQTLQVTFPAFMEIHHSVHKRS